MANYCNRRPYGRDAIRTIDEDTRYVVRAADLGFYDADRGQTLAGVRIDSLPARGLLRLDGQPVLAGQFITAAALDAGRLSFVPAADASGATYASFSFSVRDSAGAYDSTPNVFILNVRAVNDAPDARDDTASVMSGSSVAIDVRANDRDVDHTHAELLVTRASVVDPSKGVVSIQADGSLQFRPAAGVTGPVEIRYTLQDAGGLTDTATVTVDVRPQAVMPQALKFDLNGNSATDGTDGNVRCYTVSGVSMKVSAFARADDSGAWSKAWLGAYGGGLGVTDSSEGSGSGSSHTVDNQGGRDNYLLFTFDQQVVLDRAYLGYVNCDSDLQVWIGNLQEAYERPPMLSDSLLRSLGFTELNTTTQSGARWADLNAAGVAGNVIIIAADTTDLSPEDQFKLQHLVVNTVAVADTAPEGADVTRTTLEDLGYVVLAADLGFSDRDPGHTLAGVRIDSLPNQGQLLLDGRPLSVGQVVPLAALNQGLLRLVPDTDENGAPYAAFRFSVQDSTGRFDVVPNTFTLSVTPVNDGPTLGSAAVTVSEEGLAAGLTDFAGSPDTTDAWAVTGALALADADGDPLVVTLEAPTQGVTRGGVSVVWTGVGTGSLIGRAGDTDVMRVAIEGGRYRVTLLAPLDHPTAGTEDALELRFGLVVSDGQASARAQLRVSVEDDAATAAHVVQSLPSGAQATNVLLVLDVSGSMNDDSGVFDASLGRTLSRLELQQQAIARLLDQYDDRGDVRVRIVTFSTQAAESGSEWADLGTARQQLAAITASGFTNYDIALDAARAAFADAGRLADAQNVAYFLSDGNPNTPDGIDFDQTNPDIGIQADEEANWRSFLADNDMTAFALGLGGSGVIQANLDPVAYDGASGLERNGFVVTDLGQLGDVLVGTLGSTHRGNLADTARGAGAFGADGGRVSELGVDGVTYTYDPAHGGSVRASNGAAANFDAHTQSLRLTTALGGLLVVDLDDGSYTYTPAANAGADRERIDVVFTDGDGDTASGSLTLALNGAPLPGRADEVDVFRWTLADAGAPGAPMTQSTQGFDAAQDLLDLRDLLQGESLAAGAIGNLADYLALQRTASGTQLLVSSQGGFSRGVYTPTAQDATLALDADLTLGLGLSTQATELQILTELLRSGRLVVDGA